MATAPLCGIRLVGELGEHSKIVAAEDSCLVRRAVLHVSERMVYPCSAQIARHGTLNSAPVVGCEEYVGRRHGLDDTGRRYAGQVLSS